MSPLLWLALACLGSPPAPELPTGLTRATAAESPAWTVSSDALIGVVPEAGDVVLEVGSERIETADHRTANARIEGSATVRVTALPGERGAFTVIRRDPIAGDLCAQLETLVSGDPWEHEGVDHPSDDPARRTRSLVAVMPWADECSVIRLAELDLGPSCARTLPKPEAEALFAKIEAEFRACHAGWSVNEESDGTRREWVAEKGTALHFARLREDGSAWQVSVGAMP